MNSVLTRLPRRSVWYGWGDPADARALPAAGWDMLARHLGVTRGAYQPPVPLEDLRLPDPTLRPEALRALQEAVGAEQVSQERECRAEHLGGKAYPDLYRARHGDGSAAPDAVVFPGTPAEVEAVLKVCAAQDVAVVPFGGGTSVVGGVEPLRGGKHAVIQLDLRRLNRLLALDPTSRAATLQAGMRGPEVEAALHPFGFTLGHYPQSHQQASVGGYVATRSAGQASTGYGRIDENVLGAEIVTPRGTLELGGRAPASAAGPGLLDVMIGSEGAFGVITSATLRVHPLPGVKRYACWSFPDMEHAVDALRKLAQEVGPHVMPEVCRLSDPDETWVSLGMGGRAGQAVTQYAALRGQKQPCLALFLWEGPQDAALKTRQLASEKVLAQAHGIKLPQMIATHWEKNRFLGPYTRDELMGHGIFVETLETATTWHRLPTLYQGVRKAILETLEAQGTPGLVQCHVSHVYETGASLYYTYLAREARDPLAQWQGVKTAANQAILHGGGTITHHHAVGTAHRDALPTEIGSLGVDVLRAIKRELDPTGILNPGKLIAHTQE